MNFRRPDLPQKALVLLLAAGTFSATGCGFFRNRRCQQCAPPPCQSCQPVPVTPVSQGQWIPMGTGSTETILPGVPSLAQGQMIVLPTETITEGVLTPTAPRAEPSKLVAKPVANDAFRLPTEGVGPTPPPRKANAEAALHNGVEAPGFEN